MKVKGICAVAPAPMPVKARDTLEGVAFVNPDAVHARVRRRTILAESRARSLAMSAQSRLDGGGARVGGGTDGKGERKQQRMLRNRESAALSRKRKSDRIDELEIQVESLEEENRRLRQRIDMFQSGSKHCAAAAAGAGFGSYPTHGAKSVVSAMPPQSSTRCPCWTSSECSCRAAARPRPSSTPTSAMSVQDQNRIVKAIVSSPVPSTGPAAVCFTNISRPAVFA